MNGDRPIALVTGAARRVGRATVVELAQRGFDVLLSYYTRAEDAEQTARIATAAAAEVGQSAVCRTIQADLSTASDIEALSQAMHELPRLDALVHNAATYGRSPLGSIKTATCIDHYLVNAIAPLQLTQAASAKLRGAPTPAGGAVVFFGDAHVLARPINGYAAYGMSKAAVTHLVQTLARELAPSVRVNGVAPGVVAWPEDASPAEIEQYESRVPLGRSGTPEEAARVVSWLILEATYITGEIIRIDGGRSLTP